MVPRGEVGIVVAGLGLQVGTIDADLFSAVIAMCVVTTVVVPPVLPLIAGRAADAS
jgi:Kef-type K+ transport system membrane component KefB